MCFHSIPFTHVTTKQCVQLEKLFYDHAENSVRNKMAAATHVVMEFTKIHDTEHFCDRGGNTIFCGCWEYDGGTSDRPKFLILYSKRNKLSGTLFFEGESLV